MTRSRKRQNAAAPTQARVRSGAVKAQPGKVAAAPGASPRAVWLLALALLFSSIIAHSPALSGEFLLWDDSQYISQNPMVRNGLTWRGLAWAFTSSHSSNWHPLTWISHQCDCQAYGIEPWGHHLGSILLHAASAVLLFLGLYRLFGRLVPCAFVAFAFALHPLSVESVAWVAERKNVLSTLLAWLCLGSYVWYSEVPRASRYAVVLLSLALALMAKPMFVTLPCLFLLLDAWPLSRIQGLRLPSPVPGHPAYSWSHLLLEKVPFGLLAVLSSLVTLWAQSRGGAVRSLEELSIPYRVGNALVTYVIYPLQMIWPARLGAFYPHPRYDLPGWQVLGSFLLLAAVTLLAVRTVRRRPSILFGWLWYLGTLVPVIGLVQVGKQAHADRYTYFTTVGLLLAVAFGAGDLRVKSGRRPYLTLLFAAWIGVMGLLTYRQAGIWVSNTALWQHTLDVTDPGNLTALDYLGRAQEDTGDLPKAARLYSEGLRYEPNNAGLLGRLGVVWAMQGQEMLAQARPVLEMALALDPKEPVAHNGMGMVLAQNTSLPVKSRLEQSLPHFRAAVEADPAYAGALSNLGNALALLGRPAEALEFHDRAVALIPDKPSFLNNRALALEKLGRLKEALEQYELAAQDQTEEQARKNAERLKQALQRPP